MSVHTADEGVEANEIALWSAVASAVHRTVRLVDPTLAGHCFAVAVYTRDIAAQMNAYPRTQALGFCTGLVHDAGKVGLPARACLERQPARAGRAASASDPSRAQ